MAINAENNAKMIGKGTLGTTLLTLGAAGAVKAAEYVGRIPSDDSATQAIKYAVMIGATIAYGSTIAYHYVKDNVKWYSVTPRGGQPEIRERMEEILKAAGHYVKNKDSLADFLEQVSEVGLAKDTAYDIGFERDSNGKNIVRLKAYIRGDLTGLTYTKKVTYVAYKLLEHEKAPDKPYKRLSLKELLAADANNGSSYVPIGIEEDYNDAEEETEPEQPTAQNKDKPARVGSGLIPG